LFAELQATYEDNLPSDDNLRHLLIKKQFLPKAASDVIRIYRDNLELVTQQRVGYNNSSNDRMMEFPINTQIEQSMHQNSTRDLSFTKPFDRASNPVLQKESQDLIFRLSPESDVRIVFNGNVTQDDIDTLWEMLKIQKRTFPEARREGDKEEADSSI